MGNAISRSPNPRLCIIPIRLVISSIYYNGVLVYIVLYIHCVSLASVTCDLFHYTITITLLIYVTLIKEHCKEAYEEALKYATHCVILSILLSV